MRESLALLELAEEARPAEIAQLMGWSAKSIHQKLKDCRSTVREHLPSHIRQAIVGPEKNLSGKLEVPQLAPVRELVAVGCQSSSPQQMPESIAAASTNGHQSLEEEAATVIAEVQAEAPRRRRRTKAEVVAEEIVKLQVNGLGLEGTAAHIAAVLRAYGAG
jgi:hypothetical protein